MERRFRSFSKGKKERFRIRLLVDYSKYSMVPLVDVVDFDGSQSRHIIPLPQGLQSIEVLLYSIREGEEANSEAVISEMARNGFRPLIDPEGAAFITGKVDPHDNSSFTARHRGFPNHPYAFLGTRYVCEGGKELVLCHSDNGLNTFIDPVPFKHKWNTFTKFPVIRTR